MTDTQRLCVDCRHYTLEVEGQDEFAVMAHGCAVYAKMQISPVTGTEERKGILIGCQAMRDDFGPCGPSGALFVISPEAAKKRRMKVVER